MSAAVPEFHTPVMTLVEASWEDQSGLHTAAARMEDKSSGGACIRVKVPIAVGSKLRIQWRFEQFSRITKYCRKEGREYLVGIQRQAADNPPSPPAPAKAPPPAAVRTSGPPAPTAQIEPPPLIRTASSTITPLYKAAVEVDREDATRMSRLENVNALRRTQLRTKGPKEADEKGISMPRKWLEMAPWRNKQDGVSVREIGNGKARAHEIGGGKTDKENLMSPITQPMEKAPALSAREVPDFQVELLPMEDIYRAAGIMTPRKGYSITKVVEMLHSQHIRGLSQEMKRAAVLMALDAAGISLEQLQHDAKARQDALDAHEADQRRQVEAEWARKAEEIIQIQAELESIKAHYTARIGRNLEGVAREKATFNAWSGTKQQETQNISEAVNLCSKPLLSDPASASPQDFSSAAAAGVTQDSQSESVHQPRT
jgi:hypothetical protein